MRRAALNQVYRLVWSPSLAAVVPVPERTAARRGGDRAGGATMLAAGVALALGAGTAAAAVPNDVPWTGAGTDANWSTAANWAGGVLPIAGDHLIFGAGAAQLASTNDFSTASDIFGMLVFDSGAGAHTLGGPVLNLSGGLDNLSANVQTLAFTQINLTDNQTWNAGSGGLVVSSRIEMRAGTGLTVTGSGDTTLGGVLAESGFSAGLFKNGSGRLTLTKDATYTGFTYILGGTLQLGNGGTGGTVRGDIINDGALVFDRSDTLTFAGVVSGSGSVRQQGSGTLVLTGDHGYGGGTTVAAGVLQIGDGGTTGAITGNVVNNAVLAFARSDAVAFGGDISGTGAVRQSGSGTLTLGGSNTYGGATQVQSGSLVAAGGAAIGDVSAVDIAAGATLVLGAAETIGSLAGAGSVDNGGFTLTAGGNNASTTFDGVMSGSGGLAKTGSGTLVLNGANLYSGGTVVSAGLLEVGDAAHAGASLAGDVTLAGGTLRGHGSIGGNVLNTGGTVMPGASTGILTVDGDYSQGAAGTLAIALTPTVTPGVGYDQLDVGGSAALDGTLQLTVGPGAYTVGAVYDILHAGTAVTGTFASINYSAAFGAYLTPVLTYSASDVTLMLAPAPAAFSSGNAVLQQVFTVNSMARGALDVVRSDAPAIALARPLSGVWLQGFGGGGEANGFQLSHGGVLLGVGGQWRDDVTLGVAATSATLRTHDDHALATGEAWAGFAYGLYTPGNWRLHAAVGAGRLDTESRRQLPALSLVAAGNGTGEFNGASVGARFHVALEGSFAEPYADLAWQRSRIDGYRESGAGALDIRYGDETQDLGTASAGLRIGTGAALGGLTVMPWARLGGTYFAGDRRVQNVEQVGMVTRMMRVETVHEAAVDFGAGVELGGAGPWHGSLAWHGQHGERLSLDSVQLELNYQW